MDDASLQWSCLSKLIDKLGDQAERLHWDELTEEVADVFDYANKETDTAKIFFEPYQYLFRLYHRVKTLSKADTFNEVYRTTRYIDGNNTLCYRIRYYDFKTFLWARDNGLAEFLDNNSIEIPKSKLTDAQIKSLDAKLKN